MESHTEETLIGSTQRFEFDFQPLTRVVFGDGTLARIGELSRELAGRRVLIVTDVGIRKAGHIDRALEYLVEEGLLVDVFDGVIENPTTRTVDACVEAARRQGSDLLIGLGGGSSMDTAKGANFLLSNGGRMADYWGVGKASKPMLPMIAVPTTAGTGSEAQSFALISDEKTHVKMACGDRKAACKVALLDPELTITQPPRVSALCGIDAIAHALESYVTLKRNPVSMMFAKEAWRLLHGGFLDVLDDPTDARARANMLWGAHLAGAAIENSMLGATHSAANPLTAHFGVTHGAAISVMLPHVIRFNNTLCGNDYAELLNGQATDSGDGEALAETVTSLARKARLPLTLRETGVDRNAIPQLARDAFAQWTARFNPRPVSEEDFIALYHAAYEGTD